MVSGANQSAIGPGRLILVVGPSGAGKDTLIELSRRACAHDAHIVFPRRIVTREASPFENNHHVSPEAFATMLSRGDFAFHWQAHGLSYALPRSIDDDIRAGFTVVANVSRTVVREARNSYRNVTVVLVTAPPDFLEARLKARPRPSDGALGLRLRRTVTAVPDVTINNIGPAETHAARFLNVIKGIQ